MLKKMQVMLPMWMSDHIDRLSGIHELSVSEFVRIQLCFSIIAYTTIVFPQYKSDLALKTICSKPLQLLEGDEREDYLRFLSEIYFEARKAVKFRARNEKP